MIYGYPGVSIHGHSVEAHVRQLHAAVVEKVFREVARGAKPHRGTASRVAAQRSGERASAATSRGE
jgi:hypothetical protein